MIRIKKGRPLKIIDVTEIKDDDYGETPLMEADMELKRDIARNSLLKMIKPNQFYPCGSGKRFKNCHGMKTASRV